MKAKMAFEVSPCQMTSAIRLFG